MMQTIRTAIVVLLLGHLTPQAAIRHLQRPSAAPPKGPAVARTTPVGIGEMAPDFTLEDERGRRVKLSAARGRMPTVLVFYRGYW